MADIQLENGYTRVANEILEGLAKTHLNGTQFRILSVVLRYTYGFNKKEAKLSESYLSKATGIHKQQIKRELKALIDSHVVNTVCEATFNSARIIMLNKDVDQWEKGIQEAKTIPVNQLDTTTGSQNDTATGSVLDTQEKKSSKNNYKETPKPPAKKQVEKRNGLSDQFCGHDFPEALKAMLTEWLQYKSERKESYKPTGLKSFMSEMDNKLKIYREEDVIALIEECMANGWRGIIWEKLKGKEKQQTGTEPPSHIEVTPEMDKHVVKIDPDKPFNVWDFVP